jgi:hypothetical protein
MGDKESVDSQPDSRLFIRALEIFTPENEREGNKWAAATKIV